jgi:quinolinate synthase
MKSSITQKIEACKRKRNAVILVHNYQLPEVQEIGDYIGDSLELARISTDIEQDVIVFCGVHFMAETAKIINPDKTVLMPDLHAGCPMADMITQEQLQEEKGKHPQAAVVTYINSTAQVKANSDICCTSANGESVAKSLPHSEIIFTPDKYLGSYIQRQVSDKTFYLWNGYCPTHMVFTVDRIQALKEKHPDAELLVHPECRVEVQDMADAICSTSQMILRAQQSRASRFIICTEIGMLYRLQKENPTKTFIPGDPNAICPNMKLTTLEKVLWSLEDNEHQISIDEDIRAKALNAIERMIAL